MRIKLLTTLTMDYSVGNKARPIHKFPAALEHYNKVTKDCPVLMGRTTWNEGYFPIQGRRPIVLSVSNLGLFGVERYSSVEEFKKECKGERECWVIGGLSIFNLFLPLATQAQIVRVVDRHGGNSLLNEKLFKSRFRPKSSSEILDCGKVAYCIEEWTTHYKL